MSSKTFKSAKSTLELTVVRTNEDLVRIITQLPDETGRAIDLAPSDAPALALAILEAAGIEDSSSGGCITGARIAVGDLRRHVAKQERATAEAKEQAELEAEALDFLNVSREAKHLGPLGNFDEHTKDAWLAVARKAREMRAEK